jgi:type IV secretion system protein VirB11
MMQTEQEIFDSITTYTEHLLQQGFIAHHSRICEWLKHEYFFDIETAEVSFQEKLKQWCAVITEGRFLERDLALAREKNAEEIIYHHHQLTSYIANRAHEHLPQTFLWSAREYQLALDIFCFRAEKAWNFAKPFTSFGLEYAGLNLRLSLIHAHVSPKHTSKLFVRIQRPQLPDLKSFAPPDLIDFLTTAVSTKKNILIAGATGSGKTTLLQGLLQTISPGEHCVVIEDTEELHHQHPLTTNLLASETPGHTMSDFCAYAMRMRPDRLILGEMRSKEVIPFLLALNTGHKGMMATLHANNCQEVFKRLGTLFALYQESSTPLSYQTVVELIARNLDYIVFLKNKRIVEMIHVLSCQGDVPLYDSLYEISS